MIMHSKFQTGKYTDQEDTKRQITARVCKTLNKIRLQSHGNNRIACTDRDNQTK